MVVDNARSLALIRRLGRALVTNAKFVEARGVCLEARRALLAEYRAMLVERRSIERPTQKAEMPLPPAIPRKAAVAAAGLREKGAA